MVVVNDAADDLLFPDRDPIGSRIRAGADSDDPWVEVVGVVGNTVNHRRPRCSRITAKCRDGPTRCSYLFARTWSR